MRLGLVVLEGAAIRHAGALRLDLGQVEAFRAVGVRHRERAAAGVVRARGVHHGLQAVRKRVVLLADRQVVGDRPGRLDHGEFALTSTIAIVFGMAVQHEAPPGVDAAQAARADEALGARFPFLHADLGELVAAILTAVGIGAGIFVDFGLLGQGTLVRHGGHVGALRVLRGGRVLVVEGAGSQRGALQRARAGPLHQRIGLAAGAGTIERHRTGLHRIERREPIGDHQGVGLAVRRLLPEAVQPLALEQAVHEVPVGLVLPAIRARRQRLRERELEQALCLRMRVEYVGDDVVGTAILPDALVAPEAQEVHPRGEAQLVTGEPRVRTEPARGMHVAVMRLIRLVGLLDPEGHRFADQRLQLDAARGGNRIDGEFEVASEPRAAHHALRQQSIRTERRVESYQAIVLRDAACHPATYQILCAHAPPSFSVLLTAPAFNTSAAILQKVA